MRSLPAVLLSILVAGGAAGSEIPPQPTRADCLKIWQGYADQIRGKHAALSECMRGPPRFGTVATCSGGTDLDAWVQCAHFELEICALEQEQKAVNDECTAKADALSRDHSRAAAERIRQVTEATNRMREGLDTYHDTREFMSNPAEFLEKALSDKAVETWNKLFPPPDRRPGPEELKGVSALYTYAFGFAKEGIGKTRDPLIRSIQQSAFDAIGRQATETLMQLDQLARDVEQFNVEVTRVAATYSAGFARIPEDYKSNTEDLIRQGDAAMQDMQWQMQRNAQQLEALEQARVRSQQEALPGWNGFQTPAGYCRVNDPRPACNGAGTYGGNRYGGGGQVNTPSSNHTGPYHSEPREAVR